MVTLAESIYQLSDAALPVVAPQLRFGSFSLDLSKRSLFRDGARVRLGSRALAILIALLERPNQLVTKQELVRLAWPTTFVEEGTLRVHVAAIRRALDDRPEQPRFIANVMGQGYRFVGEVVSVVSPPPPSSMAGSHSGVRLVGREAEADMLLRLMTSHRLVTLVGPWGVGKSALAAVVAPGAARMAGRRLIRFNVAELVQPRDLSAELAKALVDDADAVIFLDNCEGRLRVVAEQVEELLHTTTAISFLVTSTEPLRVASERVLRLPPLSTPGRTDLTLQDALAYPAIQLLVDRLQDADDGIPVLERDNRALLTLAARLGGYPLAIEMAASEARFSGLHEVLNRSTAAPDLGTSVLRSHRHVSFNHTPDKDDTALNVSEREVLQRLSIFGASFALDDAIHICATGGLSSSDVVTSISNLVLKSYLTRSRVAETMRYRVPGHVRHYFRGAFKASTAQRIVASMHAEWALAQARDSTKALRHLGRQQFIEVHGELVDDFLDAIAFSLDGDTTRIAAPLLLAAAPTLLCCNRHTDTRELASRIIKQCSDIPPAEMLRLVLLQAVIQEDFVAASSGDESIIAKTSGMRNLINDDVAEAETFLVASALLLRQGCLSEGLESAALARAHARAAGDRPLELTSLRLSAELLHYTADHAGFEKTVAAALAMPTILSPLFGTVTSYVPSALSVLRAKELWLTGQADAAMATVLDARLHAREGGPWARAEALALGLCPILCWRGDFDEALSTIDELESIATDEKLPHWATWCAVYQAARHVRTAQEGRWLASNPTPRLTSFLQAETWVTISGLIEGSRLVANSASAWCAPEVMRLEGVSLLARQDIPAAEARLLEAHGLANQSGLHAWSLRSGISLAKLWRDEQPSRAADVLEGALELHDSACRTVDLVAARALLDTVTRRSTF